MPVRLVQRFEQPIQTAMMNHPTQEVRWSLEGSRRQDGKGEYQRVGSWTANHWFHVACGATERATLGNARRALAARARRAGKVCTFRYEESD